MFTKRKTHILSSEVTAKLKHEHRRIFIKQGKPRLERALSAHAEDLGVVPSPPLPPWWLTVICKSSSRNLTPSSGLYGCFTYVLYTYIQEKHSYTLSKNKFLKIKPNTICKWEWNISSKTTTTILHQESELLQLRIQMGNVKTWNDNTGKKKSNPL